MKFVIQRVENASIKIDGVQGGSIGKGLVVLIGAGQNDTKETADKFIKKLLNMRIFEDEEGKTNLSLKDVNGELMLVSQFTLYANCRKGNRPSFTEAGAPAEAEALYDYIVDECRKEHPDLVTGSFGSDMKVSLVNDGPFTIILDDSIL